jgi:hypothetical protein
MRSAKIYVEQELMGWKVWGLPAFAAIFAPWQEKISSMALISDWFQPTLNIGASIIGPLTCMVTYMALNGSTKGVKRAVAVSCLGAFVILLLACLMTKYTLQSTAIGSTFEIHVAWIVWATVYLLLFMSLAISMVAAFHLRGRQPPTAEKAPHTSATRRKSRGQLEQGSQ